MSDEKTTNSIQHETTKQYDLICSRQNEHGLCWSLKLFAWAKTKKNWEPLKSPKMMMTNNNVFFSHKQTVAINILSKKYYSITQKTNFFFSESKSPRNWDKSWIVTFTFSNPLVTGEMKLKNKSFWQVNDRDWT